MRRLLLLSVLLPALAFVGCGTNGERAERVGDTPTRAWVPGGSFGGSEGASRLSYPSGPYGSANPDVGEVVPNLEFQGYVNPDAGRLATESDFGTLTLQELRRRGRDYVVIHVGSYWCASCSRAALSLAAGAEDVLAAGGEVLELLIDGPTQGVEPTQAELEDWADRAALTVTTVAPGDDATLRVFPDRAHAYIIDLQTMEVVWHRGGTYISPDVAEEAIDEALQNWLR